MSDKRERNYYYVRYNTSTLAIGDTLVWNGTEWINTPAGSGGPGGGGDITGAANVGTGEGSVFRDETTGVLNLKTLKQGTNVTLTNNANDVTIAASGAGGSTTLDGLTDVAITSAARGDIIVRDATQYVNKAKGTANQVLGMDATATDPAWTTLSIVNADVNASAAIAKTKLANLDIVNADINTSAAIAWSKLNKTGSAINDLDDVTITTPSSNQVLKYNGTVWVNGTDDTAGTAAKVYGHNAWYMYIDAADANKIKAINGTTELIHATDAGELIMDIFDAMGSTPFVIHVGPGDFPFLTWTKSRTAKSNWAIIGQGIGVTNFVADNTITSADVMILSGDAGGGTSDLPLTANATAGTMTVTMSSGNGATLTTNDYILIRSTKKFSTHASSVNVQGEIKRVKSIASGVITLDTPLHDTYNTADTANAREMNILRNIRLQDFSIVPESGFTGTGTMLRVKFCDNATIENVEIKNAFGQFGSSFYVNSCINSRLIHPVCRYDPAGPADNSQYGIAVSDASENVIIDSPLIMGRFRHGLVIANGSAGLNSSGVCRQIEINQGMIIGSLVTSYDTHMEGEYIRFNDCTVIGTDPAATTTAGGFQARCRKCDFINPQVVNNVGVGIFFFEDAHGGRVIGGKIAKIKRTSSATNGYGIWINTGVTDIEINGTLVEACGTDAIKIQGDNPRTKIMNCTLKNNAVEATGYGIACTSATACLDCSIKQNTITGNTAAINVASDLHLGWDIQSNRCEGNTNLSVIKGATHNIRDNRGLTGFDEDILMNRTATSKLKFGGHAISTATGGNGVLTGFLTALGTGTYALGFTDTDGARGDFTTGTTAADVAGFRTNSTLTRRVRIGALYFRFAISATTTANLFIGLTSASTSTMSGTDPLNARHGIAVVINGGFFRVAHNDGTGVTVFENFDVAQAVDTGTHTAKILATTSGYIVDWDDGETSRTIITDVPASGQGMGGQAMIEATAGSAARTLQVYSFEGYF